MKAQSRKASLAETVANVAVGLVVAMIANEVILVHGFGYAMSLTTNATITILYTGITMIRSYLFRRLFNWFTEKALPDYTREDKLRQQLERVTKQLEIRTGIRAPKYSREGLELKPKTVVIGDCELPEQEVEAINHLAKQYGYERQLDGSWKRQAFCITCRRPV